jgi:DNA-binding NarL/FixJ family response regulator
LAAVKLVIVDDQLSLREMLGVFSELFWKHTVVGSCGEGREALPLIRRTQPDVVLLDLMLPDISGFEVAAQVGAACPQVRCLFMSADSTELTFLRVEQAGACGFIDKNTSVMTEIETALRTVAAGRTFYSASYLHRLRRRLTDPLSFDKLLTAREQEVLALIGHGRSDGEIAACLGLAVNTVATHRSRLMHKLNLHSTPKLMKYATDHGFTQYGREQLPAANCLA